MGQEPPGNTPKKFLPGLVSKNDTTDFGSVFSANGLDFYYATEPGGIAKILNSKYVNGQWTPFEKVIEMGDFGYNDPFLSNDEQQLFYISRYPRDENDSISDYDIWYSNKEGDGWSKPINAGPKINTDYNEYYISFTDDGSMYFSSNKEAKADNDFNIYRAQFNGKDWDEPVILPEGVNTKYYEADVFIAPDESYMIFSSLGRPDSKGGLDLYISFKENGEWTEAQNMGSNINSGWVEYCPFVTKDGKYLFFTRANDIYWVSTEAFKE